MLLKQLEYRVVRFHDQPAIRSPRVTDMKIRDGIDLGVKAYSIHYCLGIIKISA
jgi:hypothetical protein